MTDYELSLGALSVSSGASLRIAARDTTAVTYAPLHQQSGLVELPDYVLIDGRPHEESVHGAAFGTVGGADSYTIFTADPRPEDLDIGAWRRWLPYPQWLTAPAAGGRRWWPIETDPGNMVASGVGTSGVEEPRISLYTTVPTAVSDTGRATYDPDLSPAIDATYSYRGYRKEMLRNSMVFAGSGHASIETEQVFPEITIGIVAVFHPSQLSYYGLFEADQSHYNVGTGGEPLVLRYTHGRFDVYQAEQRVVSHETHKGAHEACIILLSMSAATDSGKLLVLDKTRTTREFAVPDLDFISFGGVLGALGQVTTTSPVRYSSSMDLLELALWNEALSFAELEEKANLLSLAYGIAG